RVNAADGVVLGVDDQQVAVVITAYGLWSPPGRCQGRSAVTAIATFPGTGVGGHDTVGVDLADAIAFALADVGIAATVHAHGTCAQDTGRRRRTAIAGAGFVPGPGEGGDDARTHIQAPDTLVLYIGNEESPTTVEKAVVRLPQLRLRAWSGIAGVAWCPRPGHGSDDTCGGVDFTDGSVQPVDDVDVAVGVYLQRVGLVERRPCGRPAIAGVARYPRPGY